MSFEPGISSLDSDVVQICQDLIRIDTTNYGDNSGPGEREAAEYVRGYLDDLGIESTYYESAPRRGNVIARVEGTDHSQGALVVHGHLDVVPADASEWTHDPLCGDIIDGEIWGRGAVDMKDMDAMILASLKDMIRRGVKPHRDLIICFFADEEHGGSYGSRWLCKNHPEIFEGATDAISEVGGYSITIGNMPVFLIQTAEKGLAWLQVVAKGVAGHGSAHNPDNAVTRLAEAIERIGHCTFPVDLGPSVTALLDGVSTITGLPFDPHDEASINTLLEAFGDAKRFVASSVKTVVNPTSLAAGGKPNVIPSQARATIDMRYIPGTFDAALSEIQALAGPHVQVEPTHRAIGFEEPFDAPIVDHMKWALYQHTSECQILPYMLSAGTDNKFLHELGIRGYGFTPLLLPEGFDFTAMFHGVDERLPVTSMQFGARVLTSFLQGPATS
jgi:acetylornithine deacetylase/succinyl-diaminopimelate desuccinylase-like protein